MACNQDGLFKRRGIWAFKYFDKASGLWRERSTKERNYQRAKEVRREFFGSAHLGTRGMVSGMLQWKWSAAGLELRRGAELLPNIALTHHFYAAFYLRPLGRFREALAEVDRALQLEPQDRMLRILRANILLEAGQTREALAEAELAGDSAVIARAKALDGDHSASLALAQQQGAHLEAAWVYALARRRAEARRAIIEAQADKTGSLMCSRAAVYVALGESAAALDCLEKAFEQHELQLAYLKVDPRFVRVREQPRFQALLVKIGLSQDKS